MEPTTEQLIQDARKCNDAEFIYEQYLNLRDLLKRIVGSEFSVTKKENGSTLLVIDDLYSLTDDEVNLLKEL